MPPGKSWIPAVAVLASQIGIKNLFFYLKIRLTRAGEGVAVATGEAPGAPASNRSISGAKRAEREGESQGITQQVDWCASGGKG